MRKPTAHIATLIVVAALAGPTNSPAPAAAAESATVPPAVAASMSTSGAGDLTPLRAANRWERQRVKGCQRYADRHRPKYAVKGWRVICAARFKRDSLHGYADTDNRVIRVAATLPNWKLRSVLAHEWGHAEQSAWPDWKRRAFEQSTGPLFSDAKTWQAYVTSPGEMWAQGRAVCSGQRNYDARPYWTCQTIRDWSAWR